jgi:hypothetical protein
VRQLPQSAEKCELRIHLPHSGAAVRIRIKDGWGIALALFLAPGACSSETPNITATCNQNASLNGNLPANPLQWKVITSVLNKQDSTMSTLYGDEAAVQYARTHAEHDYPNGSTLALVTWAQADDPRWFGAKIPGQVKSVEFVFVHSSGDGTSYAIKSTKVRL